MMGEHEDPARCPDDQLLASLLENTLAAGARPALESHVAGCPACSDVVAAAAAVAPGSDDPFTDTAYRRLDDAGDPIAAHRATRRRLALAAGLALAATLGGYGAGRFLLDRAAAALTRRASALVGAPVVIGRVGIGFGGDLRTLVLRLRDVRAQLRTDVPTLESLASEVDLVLALDGRADHPLGLARVRVIGPRFALPWTWIPGAGDAAGGAPRGRGTRALHGLLRDGAVVEIVDGTVVAGPPDAPTLAITQINGEGTPDGARVRLTLGGSVAGASIGATGTMDRDTGHTLAMRVVGRGLALDALPVLRDRLSGVADLQLTLGGPLAGPAVQGRMVVRDGRVRGWNPLPVLFLTKLPDAVTAAVPDLLASDAGFHELRVAFAARRGRWRIPRLSLARTDLTLAASIRPAAASHLSGNGAALVSGELARTMVEAIPALARYRRDDAGLVLPVGVAGTIANPVLVPQF